MGLPEFREGEDVLLTAARDGIPPECIDCDLATNTAWTVYGFASPENKFFNAQKKSRFPIDPAVRPITPEKVTYDVKRLIAVKSLAARCACVANQPQQILDQAVQLSEVSVTIH